jgi:hypothetical protein
MIAPKSEIKREVIQFPKNRIVRINYPVVEDVEVLKENGLKRHIESIISDSVTEIMESCHKHGIETNTETFHKDFSLAVDAIRSAIYRVFSYNHALQKFVDENVKLVIRDKEGNVVLAEETETEASSNNDVNYNK